MATDLYVALNADDSLNSSGLNTTIYAEKDTHYDKCIESSSVTASFDPSTKKAEAYCEPKGSGDCAFDSTEYGVYFFINQSNIPSNKVGGFHFKKEPGKDWENDEVWNNNEYQLAITPDASREHNKYTCHIFPAAVSIFISLGASTELDTSNLVSTIYAKVDEQNSWKIQDARMNSPFGPSTKVATATCNLGVYAPANPPSFGILFYINNDPSGAANQVGSVQYGWNQENGQWQLMSPPKYANGYMVVAPPATKPGIFTITIEPNYKK